MEHADLFCLELNALNARSLLLARTIDTEYLFSGNFRDKDDLMFLDRSLTTTYLAGLW